MKHGSVDNLLKMYSQATRWEKEKGRQYYQKQRERLRDLGATYGFTLEASSGAFAALSPNKRESDTYRDLTACMKHVQTNGTGHPKVSAYRRNCDKALIILRGRNPQNVLKGSKVLNFYYNTMDPENPRWVTVDGHLVSAWTGTRLTMKRWAGITAREYQQISRHVMEAAERVGILPCQFHSTIWLVQRRINKDGSQLPLDF